MKKKILYTCAIILGLFQLYTAGAGPFPGTIQRSIHLGFGLIICFLAYPTFKDESKEKTVLAKLVTIIGIMATFIGSIYMILNFERIIYDVGYAMPNNTDIVVGLFMIVFLIECCRRTIGMTFTSVVLVFLLYARFGNYFPGMLYHEGFSFSEIIANAYLNPLGIYGSVTGTSSTVIAIFVIFGAFLLNTGGAQTFLDIAMILAGRLVGGGAKVAIVASAFFGMINGSTTANVATTGSFTIPMMKKMNYPSHLAAGVESAASIGGQILPPIMGAGAFVMAEVLGVPYLDIVKSAAIPGMLYFSAAFISVHLFSQKNNLEPMKESETPDLSKKKKEIIFLIIPVAILITMIIKMFSPTFAAFWSILTIILLHIVSKSAEKNTVDGLKNIINSLKEGAETVATVGVLIGAAQIVIGIVGMTGLALKFSSLITLLGQGNLIISLILTMVICIILGMGIPTVPAYVITIAVVAPAMNKIGLNGISLHLFAFYFAVVSAITPPVAGAVYVSSMIAKSNWWETAKSAIKLGIGGFIVPYMFVLNNSLLAVGSIADIALGTFMALVALIMMCSSLIGYFKTPLHMATRIVLFIGAILLINPNLIMNSVGLVSIIIAALINKSLIKKIDVSINNIKSS